MSVGFNTPPHAHSQPHSPQRQEWQQRQNKPRQPRWPLWLLLILLSVSGGMVWLYWPSLLLYSGLWQREAHQLLVTLLQQTSLNASQVGWSLLGLSLIYGAVHAAGPGHGKVIITTYLATHPSALRSSLHIVLLSSLLQGTVAISLVSVMLFALDLSVRSLHQGAFWLEKGSYLLMMLLGIGLCYRAVKQLWKPVWQQVRHRQRRDQHTEHTDQLIDQHIEQQEAPLAPQVTQIEKQHPPIHHLSATPSTTEDADCCGCHLHSATLLKNSTHSQPGWKTRAGIILSIGIRPCSGAVLVLLFSKTIGIFAWGVAAVVAMSAGTALTVSLLALLVHASRATAEKLYQGSVSHRSSEIGLAVVSLLGGLLLLVGGAVLYQGAAAMLGGGLLAR
jgi:nickel/cobalt transporter (NicO) family protein